MMATPASEEKQEAAPDQPEKIQVQRVFVVLNPVAGLTDADNAKDLITTFCQERGWDCDIHETQKNEDVSKLVKDALEKGVDLVIAAGGDGTVSGVVAGMLNSKVPMGILPAGTGNNLARDLSIPVNLAQAMSLFDSEHTTRTMDVMEVNGSKYYVLNVSVGVSSITMRTTKRHEKRRFGMLAYLFRAVGSIRNSSLHRFHVKVDGRPVRFTASELMVANSKFMGLQPQIQGVEVDPNDGSMDMFVVRAQSTKDYLNVLSRFLMHRRPSGASKLHHMQAHETIEIRSEFPLPVQADGEAIGNTPVSVRLIPDALRIIVPKVEG
jgi:YegS/Rv2252/BmrU family lipid kinase